MFSLVDDQLRDGLGQPLLSKRYESYSGPLAAMRVEQQLWLFIWILVGERVRAPLRQRQLRLALLPGADV